jgi:hypothetical protein
VGEEGRKQQREIEATPKASFQHRTGRRRPDLEGGEEGEAESDIDAERSR